MQHIPNLQLSDIAGLQHADDDLHYEALGTLASQLGRQMFMHRHDRYFQVHYVLEGPVRVQLEDRVYRLQGPMVFLTPPAFVHAFVTDDDADGHVLTVRQQLLWPLLNQATAWSGGAHVAPLCLAIQGLSGEPANEARRMDLLFGQLQQEYTGHRHGRAQSMALLAQLVFISLLRLSPQAVESPPACRETLQLFLGFSTLMEDGFCRHWAVPRYADQLGISEQRLNEICHEIAGKPPKRLIHERLMQEARRLLLYTNQAVSQVGYQLGFEDPAYFGRFFLRHAGLAPGSYRNQMAQSLAPPPPAQLRSGHNPL